MRMTFGRGCIPFVLLALPAIAPAQDSGGATRGVDMFNQCAEVANDAERLACFDRVTREMRAANRPGGTAATTARPSTPQQSAQQERDDFGLNPVKVREQRSQPEPVKQIKARLAAAKVVGPGYWTFLLDDGAIWQMSELDPNFLPPRRGDTVRVRRGVMGGFLMDTSRQAAIRVKRIS